MRSNSSTRHRLGRVRSSSSRIIAGMITRVVGASILAFLGTFPVAVGVVSGHRQSDVSWSPVIAALPSPAGSNTAQPQLSSSKHGVLLSWIERDGDKATLRYAERNRDGWS